MQLGTTASASANSVSSHTRVMPLCRLKSIPPHLALRYLIPLPDSHPHPIPLKTAIMSSLVFPCPEMIVGKIGCFNPLHVSANNDQDQFSPNNIRTLSRDKLWKLIKWLPKRKCLDLLSNSLNSFFKEMYGDQFFYVDTGA